MERVIVVGAGLAGVRSVEALRARGYRGHVTLIGAEPHPPYDRPPLSKAVLLGAADDSVIRADWDALDVELLLGTRATGLREEVVETSAGPLDFDGLVIATGAAPVGLPGGGPQRFLHTIDDARYLRSRLRPGRHIVIVGAGWIGAEVATAARRAGCRVTVVEAGPAPLARALGAEVGAQTERWYARAGVELLLGATVAAVEAGGLTLADGTHLSADEVVVGIGVRPEIDWLDGSGIELGDGVVVDEHLVTNRPDVVAVGDCASFWSRRYDMRMRIEHWDTALNAPEVAADNLLGGRAVYDPVPYFWSEQFGRMVQYGGHHSLVDELVWRGDPNDDGWSACWLAGDRLTALLAVDRPRDLVQARRVIGAGSSVDRERIADPAVPIRDAALR